MTFRGQKAPSTKRCIKTPPCATASNRRSLPVRKHRAPKGALRHAMRGLASNLVPVRKHRAPKGALRHIGFPVAVAVFSCQKAPSAKRCIKTVSSRGSSRHGSPVRKHRAPKGALGHIGHENVDLHVLGSESTERQKVH